METFRAFAIDEDIAGDSLHVLHSGTDTQTQTHTRTNKHTHIHAHTHTHKYTHTHTHTTQHKHTDTCVFVCLYRRMTDVAAYIPPFVPLLVVWSDMLHWWTLPHGPRRACAFEVRALTQRDIRLISVAMATAHPPLATGKIGRNLASRTTKGLMDEGRSTPGNLSITDLIDILRRLKNGHVQTRLNISTCMCVY